MLKWCRNMGLLSPSSKVLIASLVRSCNIRRSQIKKISGSDYLLCMCGRYTRIVPPATKTDIERVQWFFFTCDMYVLLPFGKCSSIWLMIFPTCNRYLGSYLTCLFFFIQDFVGCLLVSKLISINQFFPLFVSTT